MKLRLIVALLSIGVLLSCKGKTGKNSIVGKWVFDKMEYTAANKFYNSLNETRKAEKRDQGDKEARGSIFYFNNDKTFEVAPGPGGKDQLHTRGFYEVTEKNDLYMTREGATKIDSVIFRLTENKTLEIEEPRAGVVVVLKKM